MKLQKLTGLGKDDPLFHYVGMLDQFLGDIDWLDIKSPNLNEFLLFGKDKLIELESFFKQTEPLFAEVIIRLKRMNEIDDFGIYVVLTWLIVSLDFIKDKYIEECGRYRQITASWRVSADD